MLANNCREFSATICSVTMDCIKAQRLFDDLAQDRLSAERAAGLRRHLADCTDCRVLQQRGARLQRLIALKRYERPAPAYFDDFLTQFHRRLAETYSQAAWWERAFAGIDEFFSAEAMQVWRYAMASTFGITMVVALLWTSLRVPEETADMPKQIALENSSVIMTPQASTSAPALTVASSEFSGLMHFTSASSELTGADVSEPIPLMREEAAASTPQYVLDRISVSPASYDVVHF